MTAENEKRYDLYYSRQAAKVAPPAAAFIRKPLYLRGGRFVINVRGRRFYEVLRSYTEAVPQGQQPVAKFTDQKLVARGVPETRMWLDALGRGHPILDRLVLEAHQRTTMVLNLR